MLILQEFGVSWVPSLEQTATIRSSRDAGHVGAHVRDLETWRAALAALPASHVNVDAKCAATVPAIFDHVIYGAVFATIQCRTARYLGLPWRFSGFIDDFAFQ